MPGDERFSFRTAEFSARIRYRFRSFQESKKASPPKESSRRRLTQIGRLAINGTEVPCFLPPENNDHFATSVPTTFFMIQSIDRKRVNLNPKHQTPDQSRDTPQNLQKVIRSNLQFLQGLSSTRPIWIQISLLQFPFKISAHRGKIPKFPHP